MLPEAAARQRDRRGSLMACLPPRAVRDWPERGTHGLEETARCCPAPASRPGPPAESIERKGLQARPSGSVRGRQLFANPGGVSPQVFTEDIRDRTNRVRSALALGRASPPLEHPKCRCTDANSPHTVLFARALGAAGSDGSRLDGRVSGDHFVMPVMCEFACSAVSSGAVRNSGRSIAVYSSEQQEAVSP